MRRKLSNELPRFVNERDPPAFRWNRRYTYLLAGFIFVCWLLYPSRSASPTEGETRVNWSNYAYSLYATDSATLCHAVLLAEALARLGSKADRVLFYPDYWDLKVSDSKDRDSQLLLLARDTYKVKLQPIKLLQVGGVTKDQWTGTWDKSVTKFMAFSLAYYDRVIALDSDITLLQPLDELFLLPQTPMAMPRAYWTESKPWPLTSMLMVIKPDLGELQHFKDDLAGGGNNMLVNAHRFDMELVNERFEYSALVLPHRPYALLTGEFRREDHAPYLGSPHEKWDAEKVFKEAKLVHFSDWPLPKPWIMWPTEGLQEMQPDCGGSLEGSCAERRIWKHLYDDFRHRRRDICRLLSVPAPAWHSIKGGAHAHNMTEGTEHAAPHAEDSAAS
ncbi:glucose N-acetyltransferase 1 [Paraphoma chrysanthemicola]|uniref:Glucose N-acetyltransferase 1 n=1 Tax=Paraphoma chrysanthemicola TaxID=798071 RepID=A0A8K0RHU1_9PLEO|nr:glucose N-acetyltransferase 1 [Paraphoma chrysanthemicola]